MIYLSKRTVVSLLVILVLVLGLIVGIYLVQRQQILKGRAQEYSTNQSYSAVSPLSPGMLLGFNVKGLVHYGYPETYTTIYEKMSQGHLNQDYVDRTLEQIQDLGGRVVRIWLANDKISDEEAAERLDKLLTKADNYGISLVVSLINYYSTGNQPQGFDQTKFFSATDDPQFTQQTGWLLLNDNFYSGGWRGSHRGSYERFIETVVSRNKHHKNIFSWEIGNELKNAKNSDDMAKFIHDVACKIKNIDPNHPVSPGTIKASHALNLEWTLGNKRQPIEMSEQLFGPAKECLDLISVNSHSGDIRGQDTDATWASQNGIPFFLAELGIDSEGPPKVSDRSPYYSEKLGAWEAMGAKAVLLWGFVEKDTKFDNQDVDSRASVDNYLHASDYEKTLTVFKRYADKSTLPRRLVRFDLSNNRDFLNGGSNYTISINDANQEQTIVWDHLNLFIREHYQEDPTGMVKNTRRYSVENGDGFKLGNAFVIVKPFSSR